MEVLGGNTEAHHCRLLITTWPGICFFQTTLALCGRLKVMVRLVFFQLRMLPDIIQYLVYHCTLLQLLNTVLPPFFRHFKPSDIETTWFWKWKSWSTKTRDANSKHVLHLRAETSSRLGSFFCTPKQWPFLWSVRINHTTTRLIYPNFQGSKMIAFKSSKIIVVMILEPSTGTPRGWGF